jgi:hypothetical protein
MPSYADLTSLYPHVAELTEGLDVPRALAVACACLAVWLGFKGVRLSGSLAWGAASRLWRAVRPEQSELLREILAKLDDPEARVDEKAQTLHAGGLSVSLWPNAAGMPTRITVPAHEEHDAFAALDGAEQGLVKLKVAETLARIEARDRQARRDLTLELLRQKPSLAEVWVDGRRVSVPSHPKAKGA